MIDSEEKTPAEYWLALSSVKGLGNVQIKRLIERFGSVKAILDAESAEIERLASLTPAIAAQIGKVTGDLQMFQEKLKALRNENIDVLSLENPNYPVQLKTIPDAPAILCRVGELTEIDESCVAIVGTREPTVEAIDLTLGLATTLTLNGYTIVSGLASGIDTCAHMGALEGFGKTIAVLGSDVSTIYPSKNQDLAANIQTQGCLLSEHPFRTSPSPRNLVQRNRIISGLSLATIVIEAKEKGGTMRTARFAQGQGKPLFACQWEEDSGREGTQALVRDGAFSFAPDRIDKVMEVLSYKHTLFGLQEGKCNGCEMLFPFRNMTIDHIIPRSRGGSDAPDNLQLLCGACNSTKGNRTQEELIQALRDQGVIREDIQGY